MAPILLRSCRFSIHVAFLEGEDMKRTLFRLFVLLALVTPAAVFGQGVQTGTLTGTVKTTDGASIPDAAVVATSPALQGARAVTTDVNGVYSIPSLPPGTYTIRVT